MFDVKTAKGMSETAAAAPAPQLGRRRCACGGTPGPSGECAACRAKRLASAGRSGTATRTIESSGDTETVTADTTTANGGGDIRDAGANDPSGAGDVSTSTSCTTTASWTSIPPPATLPATFVGNKLGAPFDMIADFTTTPPPCTCACGEYRQYVRGTFKKNGAVVTHTLCGTTLSPTSFQEDCAVSGGRNLKYGYHSIPFATSNFSQPDQATGCHFDGFDYPGIKGATGDNLEIDLDFQASLVDVCNGATLKTAEWSVAGAGTVP